MSWRQSYVHSKLSGVSGVKMAGAQDRLHTAFLSRWAAAASHRWLGVAGPYGWVPPEMWYTDTNWEGTGSAFGFATEISPGAAPLTLDSMKKTVAKDALWDPETGPTEDWNYHCGAAGKPPAPSSPSALQMHAAQQRM